MKYAIIDTNMLVTLAEGSRVLDILKREHSEYTPAVLTGVLEELEEMATKSRSASARAAKLAKRIVLQQDLKVLSHSPSYVDDALLTVASKDDVILTLDKQLIQRARKQGLRVLTLARKQLVFVA